MLVWASFRAHAFRKLIGWSLVGIVAIIACGAIYTQLSGLASGETEPTETVKAIGLAVVIIFFLLEAGIGILGVLLSRKLFIRHPAA